MAFDAYLKLEGIDGEATTEGYRKWIQVLWYSTGVSQHGGGSESGTATHSGGRADFTPFMAKKRMDTSSPLLAEYCASGKYIKSATLAVCKSTGENKPSLFMEYKLTNVMVMSITTEMRDPDKENKPIEVISLACDVIEWSYTAYDAQNKPGKNIATGWNIAGGKKA